MSRLSVLAVSGNSGGGGVDPDAPVVVPPTDYPYTTDPLILALRPDGRLLAAVRVSTPEQVTAADTTLNNAVSTEGFKGGYLAWGDSGPDYSTRQVMSAGTYPDAGITDWRAVVGAGGPGNRTVINKPGASGGAVHSYGAAYMENLHMVGHGVPNATGPKYPWHITGGPYSVAVNCVFDCSGYESSTAFIGADGQPGHLIVIYKGDFRALPGDSGSFNIHGPADGTPPDRPLTLVFIDCIGLDETGLSVPAGVATNGEGSSLYVINTPCASLSGVAGTHIYTDGDAPASGFNAATIHRGVSQWTPPDHAPLPDNDYGYGYYYPSAIASPPSTHKAKPTVDGQLQPVAGRIYYVKVHLDTAARITHSGVSASVGGGTWNVRHDPIEPQNAGQPPATGDPWGGGADIGALAVGSNLWQHYYARSRYPGSPGFWVAIKFSSTAARVDGSTAYAAGEAYYSDNNGASVVAVAPGALHPLPFLRGT